MIGKDRGAARGEVSRLVLSTVLVGLLACGDDDSAPDRGDGGASIADGGTLDGAAGGGEGDLVELELAFAGCQPRFDGDLVVVANDASIAVSSIEDGFLAGSVQLALEGASGAMTVSSAERAATGWVINVLDAQGTFTNLAGDPDVLAGSAPDPIAGTVIVHAYHRSAGMVDLEFQGVVLEAVGTSALCTVDGTLRTFGLSF